MGAGTGTGAGVGVGAGTIGDAAVARTGLAVPAADGVRPPVARAARVVLARVALAARRSLAAASRGCAAVCLGAAGLSGLAQAGPPGTAIYTCVDTAGKRINSDRPIAECNARDQRLLNADGSVRQIVRPPLTADERSELEARERDAEIERKRQQEAVRRDRNLLARYPNEAAHRRAREAALEDVRGGLRQSQTRLERLAAERKPLMEETEFYVGKPLPMKLKLSLDANDAAVEAQKSLVQNQQLEALRIDQLYDTELERLRRLWNGAPPGSLGPVAGVAASAPARR